MQANFDLKVALVQSGARRYSNHGIPGNHGNVDCVSYRF